MRRLVCVGCLLGALLVGTAWGQQWRIGIALEGQVFPFGLTGFVEVQQGVYGTQARIGWDLFGGLYGGVEGFWEPIWNARVAGGLLIYPGVARAAPDLNFTGVMLYPHVGTRRRSTGWGHIGLGLPLQPDFYRRLEGDWAFLGLVRTRLQVVRASAW